MKNLHFLICTVFLLASCNVHSLLIDTPNSGRTVLVTVHPVERSIAFLISGAGLLYKTKNEGAKWDRQFIPFRAVDIKFDPNNYDNLVATGYSVNGDGKGGVYISRDGGINWSKPSALNRSMEGFGISFSSNRVFVATNEGVAYSDNLTDWIMSSVFHSDDKTILSIIDRGNGKINFAGNQGVGYSEDNGITWQISSGDISENANDHDTPHNVNKFAFIPNTEIVFLTTQTVSTQPDFLTKLYLSIDGGKIFRPLETSNMRPYQINRPSFVKLILLSSGAYRLYFGNGVDLFTTRIEISLGVFPTLEHWEKVEIDHPDIWDIGFWGDRPLYILSDGGVHKTSDNGRTWKMIGGKTGLNNMEIYTVAVQQITGNNHHNDIYIGTQDNGYWVTSDKGRTWQSFCNEGPLLEITPNETDDNQVNTIIGCIGIPAIITDAHFGNWRYWQNSSDIALSAPFYLKKDINSRRNIYFQNTNLGGRPNSFEYTSDFGNNYHLLFVQNVNTEILSFPKIVGSSENPVIYFGSRIAGDRIGLTRVDINGTWALNGSQHHISLDNNGSIEHYWRMWDPRCNFGVDPNNASHIIVADAVNQVMKVTRDGGLSWQIDNDLTQLITNNGTLRFLGAVKDISFNRYNTQEICVGTLQSGVIYSSDEGQSWCKIDGTENIPNIESFAFGYYDNYILVATFGAGLYLIEPKCAAAGQITIPPINPIVRPINPISVDSIPRFYGWGNSNPLFFESFNDVIDCPSCIFLKTTAGNIIDIKSSNDSLQEIVMDTGKIDAYDNRGDTSKFGITVMYQNKSTKSEINNYQKGTQKVKGMIIDGKKIVGLAFADRELIVMKKEVLTKPYIHVLPSSDYSHLIKDEIELWGGNFTPNQIVEIFINGTAYSSALTNSEGQISHKITNFRTKGLCKIKAVQKTNNIAIEANTEIFKPNIHDKRN